MSRWKKCAISNCLRPAIARKMCLAHYQRAKRGHIADADRRPLSHRRLVMLAKAVWSKQ